jgi:hypothetical protein
MKHKVSVDFLVAMKEIIAFFNCQFRVSMELVWSVWTQRLQEKSLASARD